MEHGNIITSLETLELFDFFFFCSLVLIIWVASLTRANGNIN